MKLGMRVGVVLGAGGVLGGAWEIGALHALGRATGWDARQADLILGTSAGALMAALLAAGIIPRLDLADAMARRLDVLPWPLPGSPRLGLQGLRARGPRRWLLTAAGLLPRGSLSTDPIRQAVLRRIPAGWPAGRRLWIVAADYRSGARVVFGRAGAPTAELADAVAASCAIPGVYRPVSIGGRLFVDGGLNSADNLDLLAGAGLDLVVCINPMSTADGQSAKRFVDRLLLRAEQAVHRQVAADARMLSESGTPVLLLEPGPEDRRAIGLNMMNRSRVALVMETALRTVGDQLRSPGKRELVSVMPATGVG